MPIYEYRCAECGEKFEKLVRSMNDEGKVVCPKCQSAQVVKQVSLFVGGGKARDGLGAGAAAGCAPTGGT